MIIPTIDLLGGKVVQLMRGEEMVLERNDPLEVAEQFARFGCINVIDLDGARNTGDNLELIGSLAQRFPVNVGGGVRSVEDALRLVGLGAEAVIVGSAAFKDGGVDTEFLEALCGRLLRSKIILAVDSSGEEVVRSGWREKTGLNTVEAAQQLEPFCGGLLFTQVDREGTLFGPDMQMARRLLQAVSVPVYIAGGIANAEQVRELEDLGARPVMGMALYTGKVSMSSMFCEQIQFGEKGLVPTVVQDTTGDVLMLAQSDRSSLERALRRGEGWYYDPERRRAVRHGEATGRMQRLIRARYDCERAHVLFLVEQTGRCCHLLRHSCFGDSYNSGVNLLLREVLEGGADVPREDVRARLLGRARALLEAADEPSRGAALAGVLQNLADYMRLFDIQLNDVAVALRNRG